MKYPDTYSVAQSETGEIFILAEYYGKDPGYHEVAKVMCADTAFKLVKLANKQLAVRAKKNKK